MFIIYGRRKLRIKSYTHHQQSCSNCGTFDMTVKVYKEYFHVFYIPFFPAGIKSSVLYCNSCSQPTRINSLQKLYEEKTRNPFYLYTGLILIGCLISYGVIANLSYQKEKRKFVENPKVGDVYLIRNDSNSKAEYYFLRISRIAGDSVFAYHNSLINERYVSRFHEEDFFMAEEEFNFSKADLLNMLERSEINAVERNYGSGAGFDRIR